MFHVRQYGCGPALCPSGNEASKVGVAEGATWVGIDGIVRPMAVLADAIASGAAPGYWVDQARHLDADGVGRMVVDVSANATACCWHVSGSKRTAAPGHLIAALSAQRA